jgi:hypothetical protein
VEVRSFVRLLVVSLISILTGFSGAAAAPQAFSDVRNVTVCQAVAAKARDCSMMPLWQANSQDRMVWLSAPVRIRGHGKAPLGVFIKAFAASAVYWDGRLIGRNGIPGKSATLEVPGLRDAVIPIPSALSDPGVHRLQIQMSTMRAPLRLASPVLGIWIAPYEEALQPALRNYVPALLTAGGMLVAILYLGFLGWRERRIASLGYLIGAAVFATAQLAAESSRAFVQLLYPAQILRLELVLLCSCGFGVLLSAHLSCRFEAVRRKAILAIQSGFIVLAVILLPALDEKIAWVILSSVLVCMAISAIAIRQKKSGAVSLLLVLGACLFLGLWEPSTFLDRDFYIWALVLLALLLVQEAQEIGAFARNADAIPSDPTPLFLGSGPTRHLVSPARIVRLAAADDYTEVFIAGAPPVLHPEPLHKLIDRLPPGFVRVHRSHAVNLAHLEGFRRGPRSSVTLSDRSEAPVSRRCLPKLIAAISA